jgi:hypothetical protein
MIAGASSAGKHTAAHEPAQQLLAHALLHLRDVLASKPAAAWNTTTFAGAGSNESCGNGHTSAEVFIIDLQPAGREGWLGMPTGRDR